MKKTMLSTKQSYLVCFIGILAAFGIVMALCESGLADSYIKGIMMTACIAIIMTTSLNLTIGVLGQLTLGCCGFEAIGAYVAALTSKYMVAAGIAIDPTARFLLTTLIGGVVACVFGILIGIPALRLHGDYLAIITLGFGEMIRAVDPEPQGSRRHGPRQGRRRTGADRHRTHRQPVRRVLDHGGHRGRALHVRPLPLRPCGQGHPRRRDRRRRLRTQHHVPQGARLRRSSAFFAGIAGGIFAQYIGSLNPTMAGWLNSINYVIMVVFGGMGSLTGSNRLRHRPDHPARAAARLRRLPYARLLGGAGARHDLSARRASSDPGSSRLPRLVNRMLLRGAAGKGAKPAASAKQHDQSDDKTVKEASR